MSDPQSRPATSSPILIVAAWLVVVLPTLWGFNYTVRGALKIFDRAPAAVSPTAPQ